MAKKTQIDRSNPALNFISSAKIEKKDQQTKQPDPQQSDQKKSIDRPDPKLYKPNPEYIEKKTRRLQLVLQPSLYEAVKMRAAAEGTSINNYIHSVLEQATKGVER